MKNVGHRHQSVLILIINAIILLYLSLLIFLFGFAIWSNTTKHEVNSAFVTSFVSLILIVLFLVKHFIKNILDFERNKMNGYCGNCNYFMYKLPTPRCPECGKYDFSTWQKANSC